MSRRSDLRECVCIGNKLGFSIVQCMNLCKADDCSASLNATGLLFQNQRTKLGFLKVVYCDIQHKSYFRNKHCMVICDFYDFTMQL